ncbi:MAG: Na(+)/H(+) antiporter subunit D [Pseudomonadota bacterium]
MMIELNPGIILILGALTIPLAPQVLRGVISLALPVLALAHLLALPSGEQGVITLFDYNLVTLRNDGLAFAFGLVFLTAAFLAALYAFHLRGWLEPMCAQMYAGAAIGAVFAGDFITMFAFWEITAIASVFLIWGRGTERAFACGMRYLIVQIGSGVILLAGVLILAQQANTIAFERVADVDIARLDEVPLYAWLILLGFGIKAAFPLLHNWLPDAYPEATVTGGVWLSAFTTKLAIYALARGFAGSDILIWIGVVMALYPLVYAMLEDDMRRVLAHAINNQLGFMVIGIGVGTAFALSAVTAQAICHVLYKALLFMSIGAVLHRTGTANASQLGGLWRAMPLTCVAAIVGALAMSTPLFAGFVAKALVSGAVGEAKEFGPWLILILASAGVFFAAGLRLVFFTFFGTTQSDAARAVAADTKAEAPANMLAAMGLTAVLLVALGIVPSALYAILPAPVTYDAYTLGHVITQFQLLAVTTAVFAGLVAYGFYGRPTPATYLKFDWFYRKLGYNIASTVLVMLASAWSFVSATAADAVSAAEQSIGRTHNPDGILGRTWSTGLMAFIATVMLAGYLIVFLVRDTAN